MIVLDTNVVSALMRPTIDRSLERWLDGRAERLTTTAVTVAEIVFGLRRLPSGRRREVLEQRFEAFVDADGGGLEVLGVDSRAAVIAGAFLAERASRGRPATMADMLIAAIAHQAEATLATRNEADFEALPIEVTNPFAH